jgi:hypothetical protein
MVPGKITGNSTIESKVKRVLAESLAVSSNLITGTTVLDPQGEGTIPCDTVDLVLVHLALEREFNTVFNWDPTIAWTFQAIVQLVTTASFQEYAVSQ